MKWKGPDSINSWLISAACCFIHMMTFGMARLSGVLFVASIPRFKIGRKQASFPYTFASVLRNVSGPLVGYLGHKFGVRAVASSGAIIGAMGAGLCYFAESIYAVTILWGAVFGLGFGLANVLLPISINQYFDKHRATASGISYSGACLGSFILPPIVDILLKNYDLSQTFLFLSGFILNCLPAALLLRKPDFKINQKTMCIQKEIESQNKIPETKESTHRLDNQYYKSDSFINSESALPNNPSYKDKSIQNHTDLTNKEGNQGLSTETVLHENGIHINSSKPLDIYKVIKIDSKITHVDECCFPSTYCDFGNTAEKFAIYTSKDTAQKVPYSENSSILVNYSNGYNDINCAEDETYKECYQNPSYEASIDEIQNINTMSNKMCVEMCSEKSELKTNGTCQKYSQAYSSNVTCTEDNNTHSIQNDLEYSKTQQYPSINRKTKNKNAQYRRTNLISALGSFSVILDPIFLLIAVTNGIYTSSFVCMVTIIVDFSRDVHIEESYEKYILMLLSVGDIVGRLGLGWITDRGYMKTTTFAALCFAGQGLTTAGIVWSKNFISLSVLVTLYGLAQAGLIIIFPIIIAKFIDHDKQTVAIPSSHFFSGPLCLAVAPLIGYFRDEIGSYNGIFYSITLLSAACSVSWMFAPCIDKCRKKC